jgi:hypothetical protein
VLKLKVQNKKFNDSTEIDKFVLIPKKYWENFEEGVNKITIDGTKTKVRIYSIPCVCIGSPHEHKIIDLRPLWARLNLENKEEVEINR